MICLLLIISIIAIALNYYEIKKLKKYENDALQNSDFKKRNYYWVKIEKHDKFIKVLASISISILIIVILVATKIGINENTINKKIIMYTQENNQIQSDIQNVVEKYQDYEAGTFENLKIDNEALIYLYPELKTNDLAKKQIDVYVKNNQQIKKLKTGKINNDGLKWLLYFGGK